MAAGAAPDTLIVLARDQASLYQFVKSRQEVPSRTVVLLDRRRGERRQTTQGRAAAPPGDQRRRNRRAKTPEAALALMSVLGFMILHRNDGVHSG